MEIIDFYLSTCRSNFHRSRRRQELYRQLQQSAEVLRDENMLRGCCSQEIYNLLIKLKRMGLKLTLLNHFYRFVRGSFPPTSVSPAFLRNLAIRFEYFRGVCTCISVILSTSKYFCSLLVLFCLFCFVSKIIC